MQCVRSWFGAFVTGIIGGSLHLSVCLRHSACRLCALGRPPLGSWQRLVLRDSQIGRVAPLVLSAAFCVLLVSWVVCSVVRVVVGRTAFFALGSRQRSLHFVTVIIGGLLHLFCRLASFVLLLSGIDC